MPTDLPGVVIRPGEPADGVAVGDLYVEARRAAVPAMPPPAHTEASMRTWATAQVAGERESWVAEAAGALLAFMLLEGSRLHSLYVRPGLTGEGIGTLLLDLAKTLRPDGLDLWVFESNTGARRLYERHGFVAVEHTDGSGNEEQAPDVRMAWSPSCQTLTRL